VNRALQSYAPGHSSCANPFQILTVSTEGKISTFSPELLGQKNDVYSNFEFWDLDALEKGHVFESESFQKAFQEIQLGVELCKETCRYFAICGGGDPSNKLYENGGFASTRTNHCQAKIMIPAKVFFENSDFEEEILHAL
jgi:uncharacterized protein